MSHLTEGQFEDILQGRAERPAHVDQCARCRARLDEKRALARRVHMAFSSIHAGADLADRIQTEIAAAQRALAEVRHRIIPFRARRHVWSGLAVAAAILIIVIPRSLRMNTGPQTTVARTALAGIHRTNLNSLEGPMSEDGSGKQCRCLEGRLDGGRIMPCCKRGLCLCGCRMREFQGRPVQSCVIQEPNALPISVVVVPVSPQALGMTAGPRTTVAGQTIWQAACGPCNMASIRMGDESCCVIGHVAQENLAAILNELEE
jgi:hypothetical protein